jgi:hypothetical protein
MGDSNGHNRTDGRNGVRPSGQLDPTRRRSLNPLDPRCQRMLEEAGYTYDERIGAWFNLSAERVITSDRIAELTPERLADWLAQH